MINRFSEDIDISLSSEAMGINYVDAPSKTYVEQLRRAGCSFTSNELLQTLKEEFKNIQVPDMLYSIEAQHVPVEMPDTDPQTLFVNYVSLFDPNPYLPGRVRIEFSVRSLKEPSMNRNMNSLLCDYFPNELYVEEHFDVLTIHPQRTLIEKILLLHEAYNREENVNIQTGRMSRHYYDLYQLSKQDFTKATLIDDVFITDIINHRKYYFRLKRFDYNTLKRGSLNIIPSPDILEALRQDYEIMSAEMIYGEPPSFEEIILEIQHLQEIINKVN